MRGRRSYDIPLQRDATGRFLPWIIALMVYLAVLALAGAMALNDVTRGWEASLSGRLTVQVLPLPNADAAPLAARAEAVAKALEGSPGVAATRLVDRSQAALLLEPWLGPSARSEALPIPMLVEVDLQDGAVPDALRRIAEAAAPGVVADEPALWAASVTRLALTVRALALATVVLVAGCAVAAVAFAARTGLAIHRHEVHLLHLLGASDGYVARQFQSHVLMHALGGAALGMLLAGGTLLLMAEATQRLGDAALVPASVSDPTRWVWLLAVPLVACLLAVLTARVAILRSLARLP